MREEAFSSVVQDAVLGIFSGFCGQSFSPHILTLQTNVSAIMRKRFILFQMFCCAMLRKYINLL